MRGGVIYFGGGILQINQPNTAGGASEKLRPFIAAVDKTTGVATAWSPNTYPYIVTGGANLIPNAIAVSGSSVFVGGPQGYIGGRSAGVIEYRGGGMAKIDLTSGLVASWNPDLMNQNTLVNSFVISGSTIYIGGRSAAPGSQAFSAVNAITGTVTAWNPTVDTFYLSNSMCNSLYLDGTRLFASGDFVEQRSGDPSAVLRAVVGIDINTAQTIWQLDRKFDSFFGQNYQSISAVAVSNGRVLVGGQFSVFDTFKR